MLIDHKMPGLPRTDGDILRCVQMALDARRDATDREIGAHVGVPTEFVKAVRLFMPPLRQMSLFGEEP